MYKKTILKRVSYPCSNIQIALLSIKTIILAAAAAVGDGMNTVENVTVLDSMAVMGCFIYMAPGGDW
jgi:hypothetical protein